MPRFAANLTMMFGEWSFLDRFAEAAEAGFTAVEFLFPYEHQPAEIADRLERNGLEQALFNLPPGDWAAGERGLAALPERAAEFRDSVARALDYALATKARRLHVMAGLAPSGSAEAGAAYREALRHACAAAAPHGIDILIEPLNKRDMPGYFLDDFGMAADIIAELGLPNLKLQFDIYHRQILHGDVTRGLEALLPITGHIQIASVPLRQEPGTGELDDARLFATLDELDYAGFVGCEYRPRAGTLEGLAWFVRAPRR
ncbi:2-oxo-tetronate isomerase [Labrys wisconsinensis]|uniref:Hydroxypyruvate isomerase n=1 Tax=Labrys wisconsinensis TaxID=425677 RepID=A0ABU0J3H8_9HYPH|nr:2-oxo-tetronate isomerase [Labrys wisconsinensis]MDQ0467762.1 hydroxypyruvate isomerase [Labrys wisconsinensis]